MRKGSQGVSMVSCGRREEEPRGEGQEGKPADGAASEGRDLRTGVRPGSVVM